MTSVKQRRPSISKDSEGVRETIVKKMFCREWIDYEYCSDLCKDTLLRFVKQPCFSLFDDFYVQEYCSSTAGCNTGSLISLGACLSIYFYS